MLLMLKSMMVGTGASEDETNHNLQEHGIPSIRSKAFFPFVPSSHKERIHSDIELR